MLNRIITPAIFSTLFFSSYVLFKEPFEFYLPYLFVVLLLPIFFLKFPFPKSIFKLFIPLLLFGLVSIWSGDNTYPFFFKIFINLVISVLFYAYVFHLYEYDVELLFKYYLKGAFIVSFLGLIQFVSYKIGFSYGYDYSWLGLNKWGVNYGGSFGIRVNSIFSEPSYFGGAIGPAFFISLYNITRKDNIYISKKQSIIIILVYFLTFSTVAYVGVFIALILLLVNLGFVRYVIVFAPLILGSYAYLYYNVTEFRERIDGLDDLYQGKVKNSINVHGSSFVQYNNSHIAYENFIRNPLYGTGLGSHSIAYDRYSLVRAFKVTDEFNKSDANSMFLRLMSETGLFGIVFFIFFIVKNFYVKNKDKVDNTYWLISSAALVAIFLQLFRQGNYTYNGFMFYMWLYYYTKKVATGEIKNENNPNVKELNEKESSVSIY